MRMFHRMALLSAALLIFIAGGCYWDRFTTQYGDVEELGGQSQAVIEQSETSPEELQKREELLEKLEKEVVKPYTINSGDQLAIRVYDHSDLSFSTMVTPDGYIGMVLAGQIKLSGLTLAQAAQKWYLPSSLPPLRAELMLVPLPVEEGSSEATYGYGPYSPPGTFTTRKQRFHGGESWVRPTSMVPSVVAALPM